ncbi:MAG: hypothetical protein WA082_01150, partial [Candidatus Moraniibacteriota bacterium]
MSLYVKNKNKTALYSLISAIAVGTLVLGWFDLRPSFAQSTVNEIEQINLSASLFNNENHIITNGTYPVRFAIYSTNRTTADAYPSNADAGTRLWEETQDVTVKGGMFRVFLGAITPLPASLDFETGGYYVGIRIGNDSEMIPRKKLGSVPRAINSQYLRGKTIGTKQGEIPVLGKSGKIDIKNLPTGTSGKKLFLANDSRLGDIHQQNTDLGTDSEIFNIGSGTAISGTNFDLTVSSSATPPALRFNGTTQAWQFSNNGTTFSDISSGSGGITGTGTNGYVAYWTGTSTLGAEATLSVSRGGTGASSLADLITLGTHTTGNYVADITAGNGLSGTVASEGGSASLAVDLLTAADGTGATSSNSGLEFAGASSDQLGLLQGCANGQALAWNDTTNVWECTSFSAGLSGTGTTGYATFWSGVSSLGSEQYLDEVRGGTGVDGSLAANGSLLIGNGSGYTLATLSSSTNGLTVTNGAGSITLALDVTTSGTTVNTSSNSGLEIASDGLRLIGGCSNDQVLAWSTGTSTWVCSNKSGGTSDWTSTGALTYLTDVTDDLIIGGSAVDEGFSFDVSASTLAFEGVTANGFETFLAVTDPTADRTITFPNSTGTVALTSDLHSAVTLSGTPDYITLVGQDIVRGLIDLTTDVTGILPATNGGTGVNGSAAANGTLLIGNGTGYTLTTITDGAGITVTEGVGTITIASTLGTSVDLASEVTGTLPVGNGGTGATTFTTNGVLYGNTASALQVTAAGTSAQFLVANGTGIPTFVSMSSDATLANTGAITIAADAVALTTDTTGNYVATITAGSGISGSSSSEGGTPTIALGALTADWNQTGAFDIALN